MLNELHSLERGLATYGVASVPRHPDLSALLKGDVIRVRLDARGAISELELLLAKDRPEIWTLRDGKHNGFPGLKTAAGLLSLTGAARAEHDDLWKRAKAAEAKRAELLRLGHETPLDDNAKQWPKPGHRARIAERLADLRRLEGDPETAAVPAAFQRFLASLERSPEFSTALLQSLLEKAASGDESWLDPVRKALVEPMPLAIDVALEPQLSRDAGDQRQIAAVSKALQGQPSDAEKEGSAFCALSGPSARLLEGPFPQPTLPSLGISFLFSRNKDIPAMGRYGRIGTASLPLDEDLAGRLSGALLAITSEIRRNVTWRLLPAEAGDKQDLLIAYVVSDLDAPVARSLDSDRGEETEDASREADVEHAGTVMLAFYDGIAKADPKAIMRFVLLRAVDPANRKAVFDRQTTALAAHAAAESWTAAMRNAPDWIRWPVLVGRKPVIRGPEFGRPLSLTSLSRKMYIRGGRELTSAPGIPASEALALFLGEGDQKRRAGRLLRLLLDRQTRLLAGLAHANVRRQLPDFDGKATGRRDGLRAVAWIGAFLFFLERSKEAYMKDAGFKFGQLLAAMDAVHMGYCVDVRGGQIPPTLIGNSVFSAAGRNPVKALSVLSARWKPYAAWADRTWRNHRFEERSNETKEGSADTKPRGNSVAWGLSQARLARRLCAELHELLGVEAAAPDDRFRAELLLGYVSGARQEPKATEIDESKVKPASEDRS